MSHEDLIEQLRLRALVDAWLSASEAYWLRRADAIEAAAPRGGDFTGRATVADLDRAAVRCAEAARLCRAHARLLREVA